MASEDRLVPLAISAQEDVMRGRTCHERGQSVGKQEPSDLDPFWGNKQSSTDCPAPSNAMLARHPFQFNMTKHTEEGLAPRNDFRCIDTRKPPLNHEVNQETSSPEHIHIQNDEVASDGVDSIDRIPFEQLLVMFQKQESKQRPRLRSHSHQPESSGTCYTDTIHCDLARSSPSSSRDKLSRNHDDESVLTDTLTDVFDHAAGHAKVEVFRRMVADYSSPGSYDSMEDSSKKGFHRRGIVSSSSNGSDLTPKARHRRITSSSSSVSRDASGNVLLKANHRRLTSSSSLVKSNITVDIMQNAGHHSFPSSSFASFNAVGSVLFHGKSTPSFSSVDSGATGNVLLKTSPGRFIPSSSSAGSDGACDAVLKSCHRKPPTSSISMNVDEDDATIKTTHPRILSSSSYTGKPGKVTSKPRQRKILSSSVSANSRQMLSIPAQVDCQLPSMRHHRVASSASSSSLKSHESKHEGLVPTRGHRLVSSLPSLADSDPTQEFSLVPTTQSSVDPGKTRQMDHRPNSHHCRAASFSSFVSAKRRQRDIALPNFYHRRVVSSSFSNVSSKQSLHEQRPSSCERDAWHEKMSEHDAVPQREPEATAFKRTELKLSAPSKIPVLYPISSMSAPSRQLWGSFSETPIFTHPSIVNLTAPESFSLHPTDENDSTCFRTSPSCFDTQPSNHVSTRNQVQSVVERSSNNERKDFYQLTECESEEVEVIQSEAGIATVLSSSLSPKRISPDLAQYDPFEASQQHPRSKSDERGQKQDWASRAAVGCYGMTGTCAGSGTEKETWNHRQQLCVDNITNEKQEGSGSKSISLPAASDSSGAFRDMGASLFSGQFLSWVKSFCDTDSQLYECQTAGGSSNSVVDYTRDDDDDLSERLDTFDQLLQQVQQKRYLRNHDSSLLHLTQQQPRDEKDTTTPRRMRNNSTSEVNSAYSTKHASPP